MRAEHQRTTRTKQPEAFSHEALLYSDLGEFAAGTMAFIRDGIEADESILVVVDAAKLGLLRDELGDDAHRVRFADMADVGDNPARIIPAWRDFVNENISLGRPFRGIGEPISPARNASALVESQRHESLLNLAFDGTPAWRLQCPYDVSTLPQGVIDEAMRSHPIVSVNGVERHSTSYRDLSSVASPFDLPLPDPVATPEVVRFELGSLHDVREFAGNRAFAFGLTPEKTADMVLALNEIAANSLRHGGGKGELRIWSEEGVVIAEVRDEGRIEHPLIGRERPAPDQGSGTGVWLANQLCDLVQIRTFPSGSVVRIHMRIV